MNTIDTITTLGPVTALIVGILIGITQLYKNQVRIDYVPVLNLATGIILSFLFLGYNNIRVMLLVGIIASLTSMGLFSGAKTTFSKPTI